MPEKEPDSQHLPMKKNIMNGSKNTDVEMDG